MRYQTFIAHRDEIHGQIVNMIGLLRIPELDHYRRMDVLDTLARLIEEIFILWDLERELFPKQSLASTREVELELPFVLWNALNVRGLPTQPESQATREHPSQNPENK